MPDIDAQIELKIADNRMKVIANYSPPVGIGMELSVDDVIEKLTDLGVTTGISRDNISSICTSERPMRNIIVASGIPPKQGENAHIVPYFDMNVRRKAVEREDGSVDFHDLGEINSARAGQELYRKVPPTIGEPGCDVMGNELSGLPGRDLNLVLGQGTEVDTSDPNLIRARIDGEIIVKKGVVQISSVHKVDGDIDFSTGNVTFNGTIKINGTVKSGFKVVAEGDVEINGNVEDAEILGGNDVIVHGGYTGNGEGNIKAGRDVILKFIENQRVEAGRDIILNGSSYHSTMLAGRSVLSQGSQSVIVGGQCEAKISIQARKLGSEAATITILKVGIDPRIAEQLHLVDEEIALTTESQEKLEKSVVFLYRQKIDNNNQLPPEKMKLLDQLEKTKKAIPEKLKMLETKKETLLSKQEELDKAYASADSAVYPKVQVFFGQQFFSVNDKLGPSMFKMLKGEIVRTSK